MLNDRTTEALFGEALKTPLLRSYNFSDVILSDSVVSQNCAAIAQLSHLFAAMPAETSYISPSRVANLSKSQDFVGLVVEFFEKSIKSQIDIQSEGFDQHDPGQPTLYLWEHHNHAYDSIVVNQERFRRGYEVSVSVAGENLFLHPLSAMLMKLLRTLPFPRERSPQRSYLKALKDCYADINQLLKYNYSVGLAVTNGLVKQGRLSVSPHLTKLLLETSDYKSLDELTEQVQFVVVQNHFSQYPGEYYRARRDVMGKQSGDDIAILKEGLFNQCGVNVVRFSAPLLSQGMNYREFAEYLTRAFFVQRPIFPEDVAAYHWIMQQQALSESAPPDCFNREMLGSDVARSHYDAYWLKQVNFVNQGLADAAAQMRYGLLMSIVDRLNLEVADLKLWVHSR